MAHVQFQSDMWVVGSHLAQRVFSGFYSVSPSKDSNTPTSNSTRIEDLDENQLIADVASSRNNVIYIFCVISSAFMFHVFI